MARRLGSWLVCGVFGAVALSACAVSNDGTEPAGHGSAAVAFPDGNDQGYCASNPSAGCTYGTPLPAKHIALTFDDGPGTQTAALSTYLKGRGIRATFFVNGKNLGGANALLSQLVADGHLVANHTQNHADLTTLGDTAIVSELSATDAIIAPFVPSGHFVFRAPYGRWSARDFAVLHASSMDKYVGPIKWDLGGTMSSIYGADWACWQNPAEYNYGVLTTKQCGDRHFRQIADVGRGIVLMHDADYGDVTNHSLTSGKGNTFDLVKYLVDGSAALGVQGLLAQGYTFVRVDEVPDIAAVFAPPPGCGAYDPTWSQTTYANEWWVEYAITGNPTAASLAVVGGPTVTLKASWGKWVGAPSSRIARGTSVVLRATNAAGTAETAPFGYLVTTQPETACGECVPSCNGRVCGDDGCGGVCGTCGAGTTCVGGACQASCDGAYVPTWSQGSGANNWWVEYTISGASRAWLEVVASGATVPLTFQWRKWSGPTATRIATGSTVVVHAENAAGQQAQTRPFGYLSVTKPQTLPCGE